VKRAYRELARDHHPDRGGDTARFHELQRAYELLREGGGGSRPVVRRGRPSRHQAAWSSERHDVRPDVDLDEVRWDEPPTGGRLDRDQLARLLAADHDAPAHPLTATSRGPGSRLNRVASHLSPDLTAQLSIAPARDDRGRLVLATTVTARTRRARRALDTATLEGGWIRTRGSSTTALRAVATPDEGRRTTALRTATRLAELLDRLAWPLEAWTVTHPHPVGDGAPGS
jgi:hypothetical protein